MVIFMKNFSLKKITEIPTEYYTGEPHLQICGNSECVVDGLKSIIEYTPEKIKLNVGKRVVTFLGEGLEINSFTPEGAVVTGFIMSMEFSDVS